MRPAREHEQVIYYYDLCHGVAPITVRSPRDFLAAQAMVLAVAVIVLLLAV